MQQLLNKYKAISQECRLRIIHLLLKSTMKLCICEMMDVLNKEQYQISRCLGVLKDNHLINEDRDGRLLLYSLNYNDDVNKLIFDSINIDNKAEQFRQDLEALKKRLSLRENGKVVVTYNN